MKARLEYDLPDDDDAFQVAVKAKEWRSVVEMLELEIRTLKDEGHPFISADAVLKHLHETIIKNIQYFKL